MGEQKFTVRGQFRPVWPAAPGLAEPVPFLPIGGQCLEQAGFSIGSRVWVEVEPGQLVVTLVDEKRGAGHGPGTR